ncbi:MAG: hypothetical protein ACD_2C00237G0001 [uncultured bacterium (gcode 4)]|uniref:Uncharacterized protein n=1 Tax=uncultured bacterium (gcode 4) TaxID=1234023 RepID=K2GFI4_9BACT|nr:MAG: hypothetical protein ACD_2C00237G0001 [uncultured bacterium (gcode 4)]
MKKSKDLKSFLNEEDWRTIKKSLLIASLWLVTWFLMTNSMDAWHSNSHGNSNDTSPRKFENTGNLDIHASWFVDPSSHSSTHTNHASHSSY